LGKKLALININIRFNFKDTLIFFIGIFLVCYAFDVFVNNSAENKYTAAANSVLDLSEGEVKDFLIVSQRFAENHIYSEQYNCMNYTKDLKQIADELGFDVEQVVGCNSSSSPKDCHAWLKLKFDFEPQFAEFVDYSKKYPYQSND
jgi:hypothetical protein